MNEEPVWEWIKKGERYVNQGSLHNIRPDDIRYIFNAPFNDVGNPCGDFFRTFFQEWQKTLIQPSIPATNGKLYGGIYAQRRQYMFNINTREDHQSFGFTINSQGIIKGFYINSHHTENTNQLNQFLASLGEIALDLEHMNIGNNFLESVPKSWQNFVHLMDLGLRCPRLQSIPDDITKHWRQLLELYIINMPLEIFPSSLCHFPELTDLTLEACPNIRTLPPEIGQLKNLKRFNIINCPQFTHLPPEIGQLQNLWGLDLVDLPEFTHLPDEIGQLSDLRVITLSHLPKLLEIPPEIGHCTQIRAIRLDHLPQLRELPNTFEKCHLLNELKIDKSVFLDSLPASLKHTSLSTSYRYFHDKVIVPSELGIKVQAFDSRFILDHDPIESLDEWIQIRGELGLDNESAREFKKWFMENIPQRAYPWFGGLDGHQPVRYDQIQWLIDHPHSFSDDDLDWIDQQVEEWADHDIVNTRTREDWEELKRQKRTKRSN